MEEEQKFKVGDVVKVKTIKHRFWCFAEIKSIDGDKAFLAMLQGHDTLPLADLELASRDGVDV